MGGTPGHRRRSLIQRRIDQWGAVTSADLARDLGVGIKTIQRDLTELARDGLLVRVYGGATAPPRPARRGEKLRLGVVFPTREFYYRQVWAGVEAAAAGEEAALIVGAYDYRDDVETDQLRRLAAVDVDGLIATIGYDSRGYLELAALDIPIVMVERPLHLLGGSIAAPPHRSVTQRVDHVYSDHVAGTVQGLDHLFALGHRTVHCVLEQTQTTRGLLLGIKEIETGPRLPYWGHVSVRTCEIEECDRDPTMIDDLVRRCRDREITALFTHTDLIALRLQAALSRAGIGVPEQVSLLSYNDLRTGELPVPISAIAPQREWVGRVACEVLVERLRSRGERAHTRRPPQRISLVPRLNLRGTTGPPP